MSSPLGGSLGKFFAATKYAAFPPYSKRDSIKPKAKGSLHLASASARELKNYILRYFTILYLFVVRVAARAVVLVLVLVRIPPR